MKNISLQFKSKRKSLSLTQFKFSKLLGISQGYLSDVENGKKVPSDSLFLLLERIGKPQEEEIYKKKYEILVEEHVVALRELLSLKEQVLSLKKEILPIQKVTKVPYLLR